MCKAITATKVFNLSQQANKRPPTKKHKPLTASAAKTAAKLAVMKMKMNAVGDGGCPQAERVYLKVLTPAQTGLGPHTMFFSKVSLYTNCYLYK